MYDPAAFMQPSVASRTLLALGVVAAAAVSLVSVFPSHRLVYLVAALIWTTVPGLVLAHRLYGSRPDGWAAVFLAGPAWGYVLSSVTLLAFWAAGIRSVAWVMLAPAVAAAAVWPARAIASSLSLPRFTRQDIAA